MIQWPGCVKALLQSRSYNSNNNVRAEFINAESFTAAFDAEAFSFLVLTSEVKTRANNRIC